MTAAERPIVSPVLLPARPWAAPGRAMFGVAIVLGMIVGAILAGAVAERLHLGAIVGGGLAVGGLGIVLLSRVPLVAPDIAALFVFGVCVGLLNTALMAALQRAVPDRLLGRVFGTSVALATLANPLGALLSGLAAAVLPLPVVFLASGVLMTLAALLAVGMPRDFTLGDPESLVA